MAGCEFVGSSNNCDSNGFISGQPPSGFSDAYATVVDPGVNNCASSGGTNNNVSVNLTSCKTLQWGIYVTAMYQYTQSSSCSQVPTPPGCLPAPNGGSGSTGGSQATGTIEDTNSIGFFNSFAAQNTAAAGLLSGPQTVNVVDPGENIDINNPNSNLDESGMVSQIDQFLNGNNVPIIANPYFAVCFSDGRGHVGALLIGGSGSGQRLTTSVKISDTTIYPFGTMGGNSLYACQP